MYKKRKYNTIVVVLLFLISIIAGVSAGMSPAKPVFVDENTDDSLIELVPDESGKPSKFIAPDENATAFERIAFGFDVVENGDGFTAMSNLQIEAAGHKQQIVSKHYRAFNYDVSEEWAKMDGLLSSKGKNRFMLMYTDSEILKIKRIYDADHYSFEKRTYNPAPQVASFQDTTVKEWLATQIKVNSFFTTINSNTSTVLTYDNKGRGKDYYTVKLRVKPTMLDQKFLKLFEVQGGINTQITDIFATFKIDKKTGYFRTIEIDGSFTAELAGIGMKCSVYYKQNYLTMNSAATAAMQPIVKANFGIDMKI